MADFSKTFVDPLPSRVTPTSPVVDRSSTIAINTIASTLKGVGEIFDNIKTSKDNQALGSLFSKATKLGNAMRSGKISYEVGRRKLQVLQDRLIAGGADPSKVATLSSKANTITGGALAAKSDDEKMHDLKLSAAAKAGYDNVNDWEDDQELARKQAKLQKEINLKKSKLELGSAEHKEYQRRTKSLLAERVQFSTRLFQNGIAKITDSFSKGGMTGQEAIIALDEFKQKIDLGLNSLAGQGDVLDFYKDMSSVLYKYIEHHKEIFSGKKQLDSITQENNRLEAIYKNRSLKDPRMGPLLDIIKVVGKNHPGINDLLNSLGSEWIIKNKNLFKGTTTRPPNLMDLQPEEIPDAKSYFEIVKKMYQDTVSGSDDEIKGAAKEEKEELVKESEIQTNGILKSVAENADGKEPIKNWKPTLDVLSSSVASQYYKKYPPNRADEDAAREAITNVFEKKVVPGLKEHFNKEIKYFSPKGTFRATARGRVIGVWENGRVIFKINPDSDLANADKDGRSVLGKRSKVSGEEIAKRMNEDIAPIINKWIRVSTHLDPSANKSGNYKQYFDDISDLLGGTNILELSEAKEKEMEQAKGKFKANESDKINKTDKLNSPVADEFTKKEADLVKSVDLDTAEGITKLRRGLADIAKEREAKGLSLDDAMVVEPVSDSDTVKLKTEPRLAEDKTLANNKTSSEPKTTKEGTI